MSCLASAWFAAVRCVCVVRLGDAAGLLAGMDHGSMHMHVSRMAEIGKEIFKNSGTTIQDVDDRPAIQTVDEQKDGQRQLPWRRFAIARRLPKRKVAVQILVVSSIKFQLGVGEVCPGFVVSLLQPRRGPWLGRLAIGRTVDLCKLMKEFRLGM
jgi:hypothetical protein